MTKRIQVGVPAAMIIGGLLGYGVASSEQDVIDRPPPLNRFEPEPVAGNQPEFVIDDCCTFPGMTQGEFRNALNNPRVEEDAKTSSE